MDQKCLKFIPHILVAPVGSTVEFLNSDKVAHNIFWPAISGNKKLGHNLGTWPTGEKRAFKFDTPGIVPLFCNVHPEMSAYVIVTPTPFYAESDEAGNFKIANVPDGSYTVTAWHEGYQDAIEARHGFRRSQGGLHAGQVNSSSCETAQAMRGQRAEAL